MAATAALRLTPLSGAVRQDRGADRWLAVDNEPKFGILGLENWAGTWVRFQARLWAESPEPTWPRLRFDCGSGFSELHGFTLPECSRSSPEIDYLLNVPRGLRSARLDPVSRRVEFFLGEARVTPMSKHVAFVLMLTAVAAGAGLAAAAPYAYREFLSLFWKPRGSGRRDPLIDRYREVRLCRGRSSYANWLKAFEPAATAYETLSRSRNAWPYQPRISVLMPVYDPPEAQLCEAIDSVRGQLYPHWELCIADDASRAPQVRSRLQEYGKSDPRIRIVYREANGNIAAATNSALRIATGEYVALLDHDDRLHPLALQYAAAAIASHPDAGLIYTDEDKLDALGRRYEPYFKCSYNYELLLAHNMFCHLGVYRRSLITDLDGFRSGFDGAQDYDLALRAIERLAPTQIVHVPRVLYHWRAAPGSTAASPGNKPYAAAAARKAIESHLSRKGIAAAVMPAPESPAMNRVRFALPAPLPRVTIIIPTRDRADLLAACLDSMERRSTYSNYDVLVIDNGSRDPAALKVLQRHATGRVRVFRDDSPFNYSALNNRAVKLASGEYVCLMNNDVEILTPDWIEEMLSFAAQPGVGAVGARLWYPDGRLQHGGVILGLRSAADHAHRYLPRGATGYFCRAVLHQSFSAVTAACLMIRKSIYEQVRGLDEALAVAFNDVDFCLRVRKAGYRNVWTPYAEMIHHESASRGRDATAAQEARAAAEIGFMERRWGKLLIHDQAYSPNLTLEREDFSMAWPPADYE